MTPWNPPATYLILNVCRVLSRNTGSHPFPDLEKAAPQNTTGECSDPNAFGPGEGDLTNLTIKYTETKAKHPGRPELTTAWAWSTRINTQRDFLCERTHFAKEQKFVEVT